MQNNRYYSYIRLLFILILMACTGIGCIKDEKTGCPPVMLKVKAVINVNGQDQEVGKETVKEIMFYVFDANEEFLGTETVELGETILLSYPNHNELHFVCWGNSVSDQHIAPTLEIGDKIDETLIGVATDNTKSEEGTETHPENLFHARKELVIENSIGTTTVMTIRPQVAPINITTRGVQEYFNTPTDDFTYVLRSGKKHIDFNGSTQGNDVHHSQEAVLKNGFHESDIFNILPIAETKAAHHIEADIYHGSELLHTVTTDNAGNPIQAEEGKLLNIYADFKGGDGSDKSISVQVKITPWGEKAIWKDF